MKKIICLNYLLPLILIIGGSNICLIAQTNCWYVRTDGGSNIQCNGKADAPYPGTGTNQSCAYSHPFYVLPPTGVPVMSGGDTLIIGTGQYKMGIGAPNTASSCSTAWSWDCVAAAIPPGPTSNKPTCIFGKGWSTQTGSKPQLWGSEAAYRILEVDGSNVKIQWLDITDHSSCIYNSPDPSKKCTSTSNSFPYGDYALKGIISKKGNNVFIKDVDVHGLSAAGFNVGNVSNWTLENVKISGNGYVGWDGDISGWFTNSSDSGSMIFKNVSIEYNGCGETYPGLANYGCFSQTQGGYGDGLGTASTAGKWSFIDCNISHNTSDGLDLLYHSTSEQINIIRSRFEGNAGNQVKVAGRTTINNCVIVGNCDYFQGKSFTETNGSGSFDHCRAMGNSIALNFYAGDTSIIVNSSIYGNGDVLIQAGGNGCNGNERLVSRNNIYQGDWDYTSGTPWGINMTQKTGIYYMSGCASLNLDNKYGIVYDVKETNICPNTNSVICVNPLFQGPLSGNNYGMNLQATSPAINKNSLLVGQTVIGNKLITNYDFLNLARPAVSITWGAYEASPLITGINSNINEVNMIKVFPQPSKESITIQIPSNLNFETGMYKILSIEGKLLLTGILYEKESTINLSALQSGVYMLHIQFPESQQLNLKILKD